MSGKRSELLVLIKRRICYILSCILFISTVLLSDSIIAALKNNNVTKTTVDIEKYKKDRVYYSLSNINCQDDIFDSFDFSGWAFCETDSENSNKEIWILLANDCKAYMCKTQLIKRSDVLRAYRDEKKIRGVLHGFLRNVSTVGVSSGVYKLYIYCKENNNNYGLVDTGKMLKKDADGISQYIWESSPCDVLVSSKNDSVKCSISSIGITAKGYLTISGWAFVPELDTADQTVYVSLTYEDGITATYDTQSVSRPDVGTAYKNDLYNNSGFKALIPLDELRDGILLVEILVSNGENVYLAPKTYKYLKDVTNIEKLPDTNDEEKESIEVEKDFENIIEDGTVKYHIDSCLADKYLVINGWAFIDGMESSETLNYLAVTSADGTRRVYSTVKVSRPDVAKAYESELYSKSGFKAVIPLEAISDGENRITVIAVNGQIVKAAPPYSFSYEADR